MLNKCVFDDFVRLNRGFDLPDSDIVPGDFPVVASTNIKAYHNDYKVEPPVVVTGRSGSLGKVQYITKKCWPLNTALYSKDLRGNDARYVYYYLQTMHLEQYNAGVGVPTLNQNHLQRLKIYVHPKGEQERIADILSSYDNLIEVNNKRIKVLEQMAENLYKEWFVRFRFPGHETAEFENGLPKGWKTRKIEDIGEVVGGGTPSTNHTEYWNGTIPWLTPADLASFSDVYISHGESFITEDGLKKSSAQMLPRLTVLLSSRAPIGYVAIAKNELCTNQGFKNIICNMDLVLPHYLFYFLKLNGELLECYASGSTFLELSSGRLKQIKLVVSTIEIQRRFESTIEPWLLQAETLISENNNLIKQRNLLLPRLMSGKLEV